MAKKRQTPKREIAATARKGDIVQQIEENKYYPLIYASATLLFVIILFNEFIFSSKMLYGSDTIQAGVYFREFLVSYVREHGSIPLWNPYIFGGMPYVDAFHGDIFYLPTFILKMIFPLERALGWGLVLHIYLAGIFSYLCARGLGLSRLAASFAGIAYMFSSYLVSLVAPGHDGKIFVTTLFPLAFHLLNRGTLTHQLKYFIGLGLVITLIILTPHPQMAYFSLWALGGFCLFRLIFMFRDGTGVRKPAVVSLMFVLAVVIGLLGSAIQFYPGYKYISEFSPRAGEGTTGRSGYDWATSWSMNSEELVGQVIPNFAGVNSHKAGASYWGKNFFKDNSEYAGFVTLMLAVLAFSIKRNRMTWFFLILGAFALVYALGGTTPLFRIFYAVIPQVKKMRAPSMIMFLFSFGISMLAAYGIDYLRRLRSESNSGSIVKLNKALVIFGAVMLAAALLFTVAGSSLMSLYTSIFYSDITMNKQATLTDHISEIGLSLWVIAILAVLAVFTIRAFLMKKLGRLAIVILIFLALIDLWRLDFAFIETVSYDRIFPRLPVLQYLQSDKEPVRAFDLTKSSFPSRDFLALNKIELLAGYHGAQLKSYDQFLGGLSFARLRGDRNINLRPFHLTGTRYIVLDRGRNLDESLGLKKIYDNEVVVYQTPRPMRRAAIFHAYTIGEGDTTDLHLLMDDNFRYRQVLILTEQPAIEPSLPDSVGAESVEIVTHDIEYQKYLVDLRAPGLLFVSENYFPGWKVKVDGEETKLLRAHYTFRAVSLDKGKHEVEFYFDWPRYNKSKLVTILTVVLSVFGLAACIVFERRKKDGEVA